MRKPLLQKIPLREGESFVARTFRTPDFEVGWHQHEEIELILFTQGSGLSFIGNHVGSWNTGDVYLLGSGLPHSFQKGNPELVSSAVVVQFLPELWGSEFLGLAESTDLKALFERADAGLKIDGETGVKLERWIAELEVLVGLKRIIRLFSCLDWIANGDFHAVSTIEKPMREKRQGGYIDRIFSFTIENFAQPIALSQVADLACMSVPAFCNWFKKSTKKTYIDFLNEVRIGYACKLLVDTNQAVPAIGYEAGYNTAANFHKQFLKVKGISPLKYRRKFSDQLNSNQNNIHTVKA